MIKIFLENITTIDFAFLCPNLPPVGKSLNVSIELTGKVNALDMLIDFSDAKSLVKDAIGLLDHKLLLAKKYIKHTDNIYVSILANNTQSKIDFNSKKCFFAMYAKKEWVSILSQKHLSELSEKKYHCLEKLISSRLKKILPKNIKKISVFLKEYNNDISYTHTLCHHSGYCQRFHGHSSKINVFKDGQECTKLSLSLKNFLHGKYFVSQKSIQSFENENVKRLQQHCFTKKEFLYLKDKLNAIQYHGSDGLVVIIISKDHTVTTVGESTIENIAKLLYSKIPKNQKIEVSVYEGTSKGAIIL